MTVVKDVQTYQLARACEDHEPGAAGALVNGTDQRAKIFGLLSRAHHQVNQDHQIFEGKQKNPFVGFVC